MCSRARARRHPGGWRFDASTFTLGQPRRIAQPMYATGSVFGARERHAEHVAIVLKTAPSYGAIAARISVSCRHTVACSAVRDRVHEVPFCYAAVGTDLA